MAITIEEASAPGRLFGGIYGATGVGKSFGAAAIAARWCQRKGLRGAMTFDTENAYGWLAPHYKRLGLQLLQVKAQQPKARSVANVREFLGECRKRAMFPIIDSLTHIVEQCELDWMAAKNKKFLDAKDYPQARRDFTKLLNEMLVSELDMLVCGRHGVEYGITVDSDGNKKEAPVAHKMKAANAGYEFDMLMEVDRVTVKRKGATDAEVWRMFKFDKDRSGILGKKGRLAFKNTTDEAASFDRVGAAFDPLFDYLLGESTASAVVPSDEDLPSDAEVADGNE